MNNQKRALVTGASGDIGGAIASNLAEAGCHVYVHANHNLKRAQQLTASITEKGGKAIAVQFDICDSEATRQAIEDILLEGPIQILVNNAGKHSDAVMAGMKPEQWTDIINVNLNGFYNVTQPLLLPMITTRWGRIINIASIAGVTGNRGQVNYAAAKAGLIGATKSMSLEMSSRGITSNVVAPGIIEGAMSETIFDKQTLKTLVPMKRAGRPEEVAKLVGFLASDDAAYITGQVININGGMA